MSKIYITTENGDFELDSKYTAKELSDQFLQLPKQMEWIQITDIEGKSFFFNPKRVTNFCFAEPVT